MGKWLVRKVDSPRTKPRSRYITHSYRSTTQSKRAKKRLQETSQVESSQGYPSSVRIIQHNESRYASLTGHALNISSTGFNPASNTEISCPKCKTLIQEMKMKPKNHDEIFQVALNEMLQNSASPKSHDVQTDSVHVRSRSQESFQKRILASDSKCNTCELLEIDVCDKRAMYDHFPLSETFSMSSLNGFESPARNSAPFLGQSIMNRSKHDTTVFERPMHITYCKMCEDRGIYNCKGPPDLAF